MAKLKRGHSFLVRDRLRKDIDKVSSYAKGYLLDVGCGSKPYFYLFKQVDEYIGMDIPLDIYEDKESKAVARKSAIDVYGSALDIPFKSESFDAVVCFQVLEHLPEPARAVSEMARCLKPGGHLILSTNFLWPLHDIPYDFFRFTEFGLKYLIEKSGLTLKQIEKELGFVGTLACHLCKFIVTVLPFRAFWKIMVVVIQIFAGWLDRVVTDYMKSIGKEERTVCNYLVVAQKPKEKKEV
ncbi:MAG: class I SAM-dependent methyltransferase [Planctomycetota bacterium]|nr:class I SAM-dependent methyltransferase [Planctomycetota bacterium]